MVEIFPDFIRECRTNINNFLGVWLTPRFAIRSSEGRSMANAIKPITYLLPVAVRT
jgi:hypothetical protein